MAPNGPPLKPGKTVSTVWGQGSAWLRPYWPTKRVSRESLLSHNRARRTKKGALDPLSFRVTSPVFWRFANAIQFLQVVLFSSVFSPGCRFCSAPRLGYGQAHVSSSRPHGTAPSFSRGSIQSLPVLSGPLPLFLLYLSQSQHRPRNRRCLGDPIVPLPRSRAGVNLPVCFLK